MAHIKCYSANTIMEQAHLLADRAKQARCHNTLSTADRQNQTMSVLQQR